MSNGFNESKREVISERSPSLAADMERKTLVDLRVLSKQQRHWYSKGYKDGQCDAMREAAEVVSATAAIITENGGGKFVHGSGGLVLLRAA